MAQYDVNLITDYVIFRLTSDEKSKLINLKLQKLLYYVQAWSLGILNRRFINCTFEAWVHGPVCRQVYDRFKVSKNLYSFISSCDIVCKDFEAISSKDKDFIEYILDNYAGFSGIQLENMSHRELPWIEARQGLNPMEHCENVVSEDVMRDFFGKKWSKINGT